jgi:hypothetical protein
MHETTRVLGDARDPRHRPRLRLNLSASGQTAPPGPQHQRAEKEPNMNDLLDFVLDAHGGVKRWSGVSRLTTKLAVGGPVLGKLGFPDAFLGETLTIDTRRQHAVFTPWTAPGQGLTFDTDPERVVLQNADGQTIDNLRGRIRPRWRSSPAPRKPLGFRMPRCT